MKLTLHRFALPLAHKFTISRGSIDTRGSLVVELSAEGLTGLGEVTENAYYGQTLDSLSAAVEQLRPLIERFDLAEQPPEALWSRLHSERKGNLFPLCAIDQAAHDLHARLRGLPLLELWSRQGLFPGQEGNSAESAHLPDSSYTIGIDSIEEMIARLHERPGWSVYKIKLGTADDVAIVERLREHTDAVFRVDANCAWSAAEAIANSQSLAELNVEFIEQPLPANASDDDQRRVFDQSALPVIADENCLVESDVDLCHRRFHGVNVKLSKCGGLTPALRMLSRARELELKTMLGCMIESTIGISAGAQLLPLLDYADLDGAVLLRDDPARGVAIDQGKIRFAASTGTGAEFVSETAERLRIR